MNETTNTSLYRKRALTILLRLMMPLICCIVPHHICAQHYVTTQFDEDDHLVQNEIYSIGQDKDGFIYIATDMGLYRFDGLRFNLLKSDPRVDNNLILGITRLNRNINVCQTLNGRVHYILNREIRSWLNDSLIKQIKFEKISLVHKIDTSRVIAASGLYNYFYLLSFDSTGLIEVRKVDLPKHHFVLDAGARLQGGLFVCDSLGQQRILYYDPDSAKLYPIACEIPGINLLRFIGGNRVILRTENQTQIGTFENKRITLSDTHHNWVINNSFGGLSDEVWVCCSDGLKHIDGMGTVRSYFDGVNVNTVYLDRDSNIWVGTVGEGVFVLSPRKGRSVLTAQRSPHLCIAQHSGNKAIGGKNKLHIITKEGQVLSHDLDIDKGRGFVKDVTFINDNELAFACDYGLFKLNIAQNTSIKLVDEAAKAVEHIGSTVWYGTHASLGYFNNTTSDTTHIVSESRVYALTVDQDSFIWCAGQNGLLRVKFDAPHTLERILQDSCQINDIRCYNDLVYLATTCGAYFISKVDGYQKHWILQDINCLKTDITQDKLVLATSFGAYTYNRSNGSYNLASVVGKEHGLTSDIINDVLIDADSLWIATSQGLSIIPWQTESTCRPWEVNILSLTSSGFPVDLSDTVTLSPSNRQLTIEFASVAIARTPLYEYRLLPNNPSWIRTKDQKLTFSQLAPGKYTFEVRNRVEPTSATGTVTSIQVNVPPKYYETTIFKVLLWASIALLIILFTIWRVNRYNQFKHERTRLKQKLYQLELEAIKAQMNPHFIHNCLNSIYYSVMSNNDEAARQLASFSRLIRTTLDFSRLDIITIDEEVTYLNHYLQMEKLRFKDNLHYSIRLSGVNTEQDKIPTMMVQPYIENAIKHGIVEGKRLEISICFDKVNGSIHCSIEDNGPGYNMSPNENESDLHGSTLTTSRADMYNRIYGYDITLHTINMNAKSPDKTGTKVIIDIPALNSFNELKN